MISLQEEFEKQYPLRPKFDHTSEQYEDISIQSAWFHYQAGYNKYKELTQRAYSSNS